MVAPALVAAWSSLALKVIVRRSGDGFWLELA
jgi:hypothetical protein